MWSAVSALMRVSELPAGSLCYNTRFHNLVLIISKRAIDERHQSVDDIVVEALIFDADGFSHHVTTFCSDLDVLYLEVLAKL